MAVGIRFGLAAFPQAPASWSMADEFHGVLQEVYAARDSGFDGIFVGHHYLSSPYQMLQTIPFLARISAETAQTRIGTGILLISLLNPVDVAEQIATLDIMSGGRVIFGVGMGYRREEYDAFGVRRELKVKRFVDVLEVIRRLWTEDSVDFESEYCRLTKASLTIRPLQKPHPPIWIAANSDRAVKRVGELGYPWLANPHVPTKTLERQLKLYHDALGHKPVPKDIPVAKELFVADTREKALAQARPHLEEKYKTYSSWGQDKVVPTEDHFDVPWEELAMDRFVIGSPEDCIQQIDRMNKRSGFNYFIFRMRWPGMDHALSVNAIRLFGREIIGYFKTNQE